MRILLLSYEYPPLGGGGGVAAAQCARAWACQGHDVTVITSSAAGLPAFAWDGAVAVHRLSVPGRNTLATASLLSLLAFPCVAVHFAQREWSSQQFDIICSFFAVPSGVAGALLARLWRRPHVVSVLGGDVYDPSKFLSPHRTPGLKQAVSAVLLTASAIITESQDLAERLAQIYRLQRTVTIIPLGLDLPPPGDLSRLGQPITIVTVARLIRRKLLDRLIQAYAALPKDMARLVVIGDGPDRAALERQITKLGLTNRVQLLGYVSDDQKLAALRAADIFALVSEHEGFGLVYLEAAAQALPIVAGTVGGQLDFLEHGRTGWLVPPGDVEALTHALMSLATQPELRHQMGQNALSITRHCHITDVASAYIEVFHEVQYSAGLAPHRAI